MALIQRVYMTLCSLFSGGKDSTMALYRTIQRHKVAVLLAMVPERDDSYMFHYPNIELTKFSAEAMGIPIMQRKTSGKPPDENIDLINALVDIKEKFGIGYVVSGAVRSNYQYGIISYACRELNLGLLSPYWQKSHEELIRDAIQAGFHIIFTGVAAYGMDESWLGRTLDMKALKELKELNKRFGIDIGGEGGEYETFVIDGPIFRKRIEIKESERKWDGMRGELVIKEISLR